MAIEDFFRHKCDIYHISHAGRAAKYGLPSSEKDSTYPANPSITDVICFFADANADEMEVEPTTVYPGARELSLPTGTDIHRGDKIIDKRFNIEYTAGFPEDIRGKYLSVPLNRKTVREAL